MILSLTTMALAQQPADWQFVAGAVLSPDPGIPFMSQSIGSPSVVYDPIRDRFMMFFESRTNVVDARCPQGVWAIGAAVSTDGINWTPYTNPMLHPTPGNGTFFSCVAAHPTAIFQPGGPQGNGGITIIFKAEQDTDACDVTTPSWGCDTLTGLGRMRITLTGAGNPRTVQVTGTPLYQPTSTYFGYPKLIDDAGIYRLFFQNYPDIWSIEGNGLASMSNPTVAVRHADYTGVVSWVDDEFFNPSAICDDDPTFPYALFVGGRDTDATGSVLSGGWGKAVDDVWGDPAIFLLDSTAQQEWIGNDTWRHFDVTKLSTGEYLVWFSEKDGSGNNFIRFGGTTLTFTNSDVVSRICP